MPTRLRMMIGGLPRFWKRVVLIGFDFVALSAALWLAFALRYGIWTPPTTPDQLFVVITGPVIAIPVFIRMGLYRAVIRYLPERALWTIVLAMVYATIGWVLMTYVAEMSTRGVVPRSVPIFYWTFGTLLVAGSRFFAKRLLWVATGMDRNERPIAIYGAGRAGIQLATALRSDRARSVAGFIDDNPGLHGHDVAGIRVFAPSQLPALVSRYGVKEVILSIPMLGLTRRKEIVGSMSEQGVRIRTIPPLADVVHGRYLVGQIREIDIDELLGRSSVPLDPELVRTMIEGRSIIVTGAGGSIGSALCRLIVHWRPRRLILFEANEFALYKIERELTAANTCQIVPVLGSVTDAAAVRQAIATGEVEVMFHAAAHKHVPLVEANALEGIRNNVFGTLTVAGLALAGGVESFVLISSDKAVRPTNVMGATKRWAELIVEQKARDALLANTGQRFSAVRFGNVLGSNGSVVPLFKEQIANGGPVTLTDPAMTRYFMSIHEAAELIVQAGALSEGRDIFLLEMGRPVLIRELAENMIRLAGFTVRDEARPDGDIAIVTTGIRPGEKLFEELFYDPSNARPTRHPKILRATGHAGSAVDIETALQALRDAVDRRDEPAARSILFETIQWVPRAGAREAAVEVEGRAAPVRP